MAALAAVLAGLFANLAPAESPTEEQDLQFFERRIRPALVTHCYECHSTSSREGRRQALPGSCRGTAPRRGIRTCDCPRPPRESLLIRAIQKEDDDLVMPPTDKPPLPEAVVNDLVEWIKRGLPTPAPPRGKGAHGKQGPMRTPSGPSSHSEKQSPQPRDRDWPRDDIDRFLLSRLESRDFDPPTMPHPARSSVDSTLTSSDSLRHTTKWARSSATSAKTGWLRWQPWSIDSLPLPILVNAGAALAGCCALRRIEWQ